MGSFHGALRSACFLLVAALLAAFPGRTDGADPAPGTNAPAAAAAGPVYVLPIRDDIMPPLVYIVRRGVKEAMAAGSPLLVLDIDTNGGRLDVTEDLFQILGRFPGRIVAYVNTRAFSAGAFIAVAANEIHMAPQSVIGAAAPVMMAPGGGVEKMPESFEAKMSSAVRALVRTQAEKNGHDIRVIEAMIDPKIALEIEGEVLNTEGSLLTLTDRQAVRQYGTPPRHLLSAGTHGTVEDLLRHLGHGGSPVVRIQPSGAEQVGTWLNAIAPILLIVGAIGLYIEFKTPGFGVPGIVGIAAFGLYFLGGYIAALSAPGWILFFVLGVILILLEFLVFPGTFVCGILGALIALVAVLMGTVDAFPTATGTVAVPSLPDLRPALQNVSIAILGTLPLIFAVARILPHTRLHRNLVSSTASGVESLRQLEADQEDRLGQEGVTLSPLSPGGRARFGEDLLDVISRGERIEKGTRVRIIGFSGATAIVTETN